MSTVYTLSEDIGMEFGIQKFEVLVLRRGKDDKGKSKGLNLPIRKLMKTIYEEGYKYLGILKYDKVKEKKMKMGFSKKPKRRIRLIVMSKLNGKNKSKAINSWAVVIMRYGAGVLECRIGELKELLRKTWQPLKMHKRLHPKSDVEILYVSRKEGRGGLMSCKSTIKGHENNLL